MPTPSTTYTPEQQQAQDISLQALKDRQAAGAANSGSTQTNTDFQNMSLADRQAALKGNTPVAPDNSPVVTTSSYRNQAQENANYVDQQVTGGKKIVSTETSNGKTTTTYSDGTTSTSDNGTVGSTPGQPVDRTQILNSQSEIYTQQSAQLDQTKAAYDALKVSGDSAYNSLIDTTKALFDSTRTKLVDSNRRFEAKTAQGQYLNNGFRYTPQQSEGMVYDAEQAGISHLTDLNLQESVALQKALDAKNANDYKALADYTDTVRNLQNDKLNTLSKMTDQIKTIEDTDKNIRNMNANEANVMNSMISAYAVESGNLSAKDTAAYADKKAKELSDLMGFTVAPEFIRSQIQGAHDTAALTVNADLSKKNGFYTDSLGKPMNDANGKPIPFPKENWMSQIIGNTLNVGEYDKYGNKVIKTYDLKGETAAEKAARIAVKNTTPVAQNITSLVSVYNGSMSELLMQEDGTRVPTTIEAYKNIPGTGGGMQCSEYVSLIVGKKMGSSFADKKANAPDSTGQVGSVAVWDAGDHEHGHDGIIVGEEGNNWIVKSSNLRGDGRISTDAVPKSAINNYYTPDNVHNLPNSVTGIYDPIKDQKLTQVGQNKDGSPIFYDTRTGKTLSANEATALYKGTVSNGSAGFTQDDYFNTLFASLPGGSKDNAGEVKRIKDAAAMYQKEGLSPQEALLRFKGFKLQDPSQTDTALEYVNIGDNLGAAKPAGYETTVAKYINNNDIPGLNTYVNNRVDEYVNKLYGKDAILAGDYDTGQNRGNQIIEIISKNRDKIGPFNGTVQDFISKFSSTPEYQQIKTLLQMSQADTRKYFAGSAVTETEMKALQDFIGGNTKMNPDNLITMLDTLLKDRRMVYSNQRQGMIVPGSTRGTQSGTAAATSTPPVNTNHVGI